MPAKPVVKAVIFDCFGVLVGDGLLAICNELAATGSAKLREVDDLIRATNAGLIDPVVANQQIADALGMTIDQFNERTGISYHKNQPLLDFIRSLRPRYKTALLSNAGQQSIDKRFTADELAGCFDAVFISGNIGAIKPNPEIYQYALDGLGVAPDEAVFLDDYQGYVEAANALGIHGVYFENNAQAIRDITALLG